LKRLVARLLRASGALAAARYLRERLLGRPALIILCYHRITDRPFVVSARCVSPKELDEQLHFFRRSYDVWPLAAVPEYVKGERALRRDTLVLTFDDGYLDDHQQAGPLLGRHGLRATFFVSTGPALDGRPYWMDRLGSVAADATSASARVQALKQAGEDDREKILAELGAAPDVRVGPPVMGPEQIADLAAAGHEIGAHGVSHPVLARLPAGRCREEVSQSVEGLRGLGLPVRAFAYPFGGRGEVGERAPAAVAESGLGIAVTTEERAVRRSDDLLLLPRKVVSSQSVAQLALKLERLAWEAR
jgi:peptidoglycan/xylan/chitin deacetylase (PgdA/CDA1 family)